MQQNPTKPVQLREIDISFYITHYVNLLWRWKFYIVVSAPVVMLVWVVYVSKFGSIKPELDSSVIIGMEDTQNRSAVRDVGESVYSRVDIIRGRSFLKDIVDSMSLQLVVNNHFRSHIFDSLDVDSSAVTGKYKFELDKQRTNYKILLTNKQMGFKEKVITNGLVVNLDTLMFAGIYFKIADRFKQNPFSFSFNIIPQRIAVDRLRGDLTTQDRRSSHGGGNAIVTIKGRDYPLITEIANKIADEFIARSLSFRKRRTRDVIKLLEKQLAVAEKSLDVSQSAVRQFRQQHPNVSLANDIMNSVSNMTQIESSVHLEQLSIQEADQLRNRLRNASVDQNLELSEALAFLQDRRMVAASVLQSELAQLLHRKQELATGFDKSHPFILENRNKIAAVRQKTLALLNEYVTSANSSIQRQQGQVNTMLSRIQILPSQQADLAELERQAQVNAQIHSQIYTRYNQAKIADATEVADIFVMDYAVEAIPPPDFMNVLILLAIGILISLAVSLAPPVAIDFFDKTVRTENELKNIMSYTVLECIPEIRLPASKVEYGVHTRTAMRTVDRKLITSDFSPDFTNELFRSLRTKIMLRLHEQPKKRILITSYDMSEGKSLISANLAITMAQQKIPTVLIDGDIRRGVQHNSFVLQKKPGLSSFLFTEEPVTDATVDVLLQKTHIPNLSLISSGPNVPNPSELLGHPKFGQLLDLLAHRFDVIIFDTPPIGLAADAAQVCTQFDATVIIVKAGATNVVDLRKKIDSFPLLKKSIIGLVLNRALFDRNLKKYKYSSYYYNT